ncbi:hypothetical protein B0H12DRAFT_33074 [Mycena haematopus]|nr:hypothetical protein B0H12DRAFT_33074 [Mycena haematopus]
MSFQSFFLCFLCPIYRAILSHLASRQLSSCPVFLCPVFRHTSIAGYLYNNHRSASPWRQIPRHLACATTQQPTPRPTRPRARASQTYLCPGFPHATMNERMISIPPTQLNDL